MHVERSDTRCFGDDAFAAAGCVLENTGTWPAAPAHAFILGIKAVCASHCIC